MKRKSVFRIGKRGLSVLLVVILTACMIPFTGLYRAEAASYHSIYIGTSGIQGYHESYDTLYFGADPTAAIPWRVLATEANGSVPNSGRTLFVQMNSSQTDMGKNEPFGNNYEWLKSGLKIRANIIHKNTGYFSEKARTLILPTSKGIDTAEKPYADASNLCNDYLFPLSASESVDAKYGFNNLYNRKPLSWTRSGDPNLRRAYYMKNQTLETDSCASFHDCYYCMNLNGDSSAILLTGSPTAKSTVLANGAQLENTTIGSRNTEWVPTLLDSEISLSASTSYNADSRLVTVENYTASGIDAGKSALAVMVTDGVYNAAGTTVNYYSTLKKGSLTGSNLTFTLPTEVSVDEHVYLVAEERNAGNIYDFAGAPQEIDITQSTSYTITTLASPSLGGSVTPGKTVAKGENVTLTATPNTGYSFVGWHREGTSGYASTLPTMTVSNVTENATYAAEFKQQYYTVTAASTPEGGGTVTGGGTVAEGGSVTLSATPNDNYSFAGWYFEGTQIGSSPNLAVSNVTEDKTYTVVFRKNAVTVTFASFPTGAALVSTGNPVASGETLNGVGNSSTLTKTVDTSSSLQFNGMTRWDSTYRFVGVYENDTLLTTWNKDGTKGTYAGETYRWGYYNFSTTSYADRVLYLRLNIPGSAKDYTAGVATAVRPVGAGSTSGDKDANTSVSTTLGATANTGYVFDHWEWTENGTLHTSTKNDLAVSVTGYRVYVAVFRKAAYDITAEVKPVEGGYVTGTGSFLSGKSTTLTAMPQNGYSFEKWTWKDKDGNEQESTDSVLPVNDIKASCHYTASFLRDQYSLTATASSPENGNQVRMKVGANEITSTNTNPTISQKISSGGSAVLTAAPGNGYVFKRWAANDGTASTENPLNVDNLKEDKEYRAEFAKTTYNVTLKQTPANGGQVKFMKDASSGDILQTGGVRSYNAGDKVYLDATPAAGMKFYRWEGSDNSYYYSSNGFLTIENIQSDITYTAVFLKEKSTISTKTNPAAGAGSVTIDGANAASKEINSGDNAVLKAIPNSATSYKFVKWMDSKGNSYTENPLYLVNVTESETYTAIFEIPSYKITTLSNPIDGGTATGGGTFAPNDSTTLIATPAANYTFDYWECSDGTKAKGTTAGATNQLAINGISSDATYTAHFQKQDLKMTIFWSPVGGTSRGVSWMNPTLNVPHALHNGDITDITAGDNIVLTATPDPGERFKQWVAEDGTVVTDNPMTLINIKKDVYYTAQFEPDSYTIKVKSSPVQGGSVGGGGAVAAGGSISLNAVPNTDYEFDYWSCDDGTTAAGVTHNDGSNTLTLTGVYGDATYTAHFLEKECGITVRWTPLTGGGSHVVYSKMTDNIEHEIQNNDRIPVSVKTGIILRAIAGDGYKFKQWVKEDGTAVTTNPMILSNVTKSELYIAEFELIGYTITTKSAPSDGGSTSGGGGVAAGGNATLTATPNAGYVFDHWSSDDGTTDSGIAQPDGSNTLELRGIYADATYTAHFAKQSCKVTVRWTPVTDGGNKVVYSLMANNQEHDLQNNDSFLVGYKTGATLRAVPGDGYKFKRWIKEDGTVVDSTETLILSSVAADAVYIAEFEGNGYTITTKSAPADGGKTSGGGTVTGGDKLTLTATPNEGYVFDCWKDDKGNKFENAILELKEIYSDATYTAYFKNSKDAITIVASPASGGVVSKTLNADGTVTIKAKANTGYTFKCWKKEKETITKSSSYIVTEITVKATYTAYFEEGSGYLKKSGITDEKFQDTKRTYQEPVYKNTEATMAAFASSFITGILPQYELPGHRTKGAVGAARKAFSVSRNDFDGELYDHEIVSTENEVMQVLEVADTSAALEAAKQMTADKFGSRYTTELLVVRDVMIPETGNWQDGPRTLLWQNTGAKSRDTIMIIWEQPGVKQKYIAGVVDEQGIIKFSVPMMGGSSTRTRMSVVRVEIQ